jgi:3',5'-cyclic-AMP phosphodiesterase
VRFVVLGDLHYSVYNSAELCAARDEYYQRLFTAVLKLQPDLVFAIGDTVDNGLPEELDGLHNIARRSGLAFYTVNGNHDLLHTTKTELAHYTKNPHPYYTLFGNPVSGVSTALDSSATRFVVLDTPKEMNEKDHGGYVSAEQLHWLKGEIAASGDNPLFVFGHHPLQATTRWSIFPMLNIDNSKQVKLEFWRKQAGEAFYFCGHNHTNSIVRRANWNFIQTAAPLRSSDFRVIDYTPESVQLSAVPLENGDYMIRLGTKLANAMGDFSKMPSKGRPSDRQLTVKLPACVPEIITAR